MKKVLEMECDPVLGNRDEYWRVRASWRLKALLSASSRRARFVEAMATQEVDEVYMRKGQRRNQLKNGTTGGTGSEGSTC